jgi:gamma-glutamyltranspeptidase / glutathione hydrolase
MWIKTLQVLCVLLTATSFIYSQTNELTYHATGNGGIIAGGSKESVQAGIKILDQGGNAVDCAVAVIFNLAVSDYGSFSIGGEVPLMSYSAATGKVLVFNGMGEAPRDVDAIDWYYDNGIPGGLKRSTVPSALSTCLTALEHSGTMSFEQVIAPTLELLDTGKEIWYGSLAGTFRKLIETERITIGTREQKILAARDRFYKGDIADDLNNFYITAGGLLRKSDLKMHATFIEEPVSVTYGDYTVYKCNTWTQGPVLLQSLRILENFDLRSMGYLSADYVHVITESMKLAFADRDKYYGDPRFVGVPLKQLLSDDYTKIRYQLIDMDHASQIIRPGDPVSMKAIIGPGDYWPGEYGTTTCVVVDKYGNVVAATPSSNPEYAVCENTGIAHNTRLTSLNLQKVHPNSLEPGKRPRITLTPTIILKNGKPILAMSVAGGDMQDQVALQLILNSLIFDMMPMDAISQPRFITNHMESSFSSSSDENKRISKINLLDMNMTNQDLIEDLRKRGHEINISNRNLGSPVMVLIDQATGNSYAAAVRWKYCAALDNPE